MKGNASWLINLCKNDSIIFLQETWLWSFESNVTDCLVFQYDSFMRRIDMNDNISNVQVPRGNDEKVKKAILWPKSFGKLIKHLEDGNERVQVELLAGDTRLCIINVYFPTLSLPSSRESYREKLDVVNNIFDRYTSTHSVVFVVASMILFSRPGQILMMSRCGSLLTCIVCTWMRGLALSLHSVAIVVHLLK